MAAENGGLNEVDATPRSREPLAGTGGSSGGGTRSGEGEPAGGATDEPAVPADTAAAIAGDPIAAEAAALGDADGSLADAASAARPAPA